ncbi:MAG: ATP synthase F0 subunit B [Myxococcota bacterium]|nr:ATP synthase F0 subunit B [Myxococcota bacterium]
MKRLRERIRRWVRRHGARRLATDIMLASAVMLSASTALAAGAAAGPAYFADVNWWTWDNHKLPVGWFILDFILFIGLLRHFIRKPLKASLENRQATIKAEIEGAAKAHDAAKADHDALQNKLANVDAETSALLERSKADGQLEHDKMVADAQAYSERLKSDSKRIVEQETLQASSRLHSYAVTAALTEAESRLRGSLNEADQARLLEEAIVELETSASVGGAA